jgi:hypothetical protein
MPGHKRQASSHPPRDGEELGPNGNDNNPVPSNPPVIINKRYLSRTTQPNSHPAGDSTMITWDQVKLVKVRDTNKPLAVVYKKAISCLKAYALRNDYNLKHLDKDMLCLVLNQIDRTANNHVTHNFPRDACTQIKNVTDWMGDAENWKEAYAKSKIPYIWHPDVLAQIHIFGDELFTFPPLFLDLLDEAGLTDLIDPEVPVTSFWAGANWSDPKWRETYLQRPDGQQVLVETPRSIVDLVLEEVRHQVRRDKPEGLGKRKNQNNLPIRNAVTNQEIANGNNMNQDVSMTGD